MELYLENDQRDNADRQKEGENGTHSLPPKGPEGKLRCWENSTQQLIV